MGLTTGHGCGGAQLLQGWGGGNDLAGDGRSGGPGMRSKAQGQEVQEPASSEQAD